MTPPKIVIGVRDSGVGGLTVAREIKKVLPHARLLYFADTAHVPYGDRSPEEVRFFALSISRFLLERGAQILVFACNTTSAYALHDARASFSQPVFGMIEPGARAALNATRNKRIGIIATQATVNSGVYSQTICDLDAQAHCIEVACPDFVPLVESEQTCSGAAVEAARKYFVPLLHSNVDTVILGCTHYPLLLPVLREVAPQLRFVDPAQAVAQEVAHTLKYFDGASSKYFDNTTDRFFVSGESEGVRRWIQKLLPNSRSEILRGPIFAPVEIPCGQPC